MIGEIAVQPFASTTNATGAAEVAKTTPVATTAAVATQVNQPSPSLDLDPGLGIVVIQFRSASGKVELSIPSEQQLDAYRADPASLPKNSDNSIVA